MGGGVGFGCYGSYWIVGESFRVVMLECGIGFILDVGGLLIFFCVFGWVGEYVGFIGE